eukprot:1522831-Prymnesium_polylepis.2
MGPVRRAADPQILVDSDMHRTRVKAERKHGAAVETSSGCHRQLGEIGQAHGLVPEVERGRIRRQRLAAGKFVLEVAQPVGVSPAMHVLVTAIVRENLGGDSLFTFCTQLLEPLAVGKPKQLQQSLRLLDRLAETQVLQHEPLLHCRAIVLVGGQHQIRRQRY